MKMSAVMVGTGALYPLTKPCPALNLNWLFLCHIRNICYLLQISHTQYFFESLPSFRYQLQNDTIHLYALNWYLYDTYLIKACRAYISLGIVDLLAHMHRDIDTLAQAQPHKHRYTYTCTHTDTCTLITCAPNDKCPSPPHTPRKLQQHGHT